MMTTAALLRMRRILGLGSGSWSWSLGGAGCWTLDVGRWRWVDRRPLGAYGALLKVERGGRERIRGIKTTNARARICTPSSKAAGPPAKKKSAKSVIGDPVGRGEWGGQQPRGLWMIFVVFLDSPHRETPKNVIKLYKRRTKKSDFSIFCRFFCENFSTRFFVILLIPVILGRIWWPPQEILGEEAQARTSLSRA
jgi:hypothetical protein